MFKRQKRTGSKGYTFPRLLKALEETDGCGFCAVAQSESEHMLTMLFHEGIMEPGLRQRLVDGGGFCNWHTWVSLNDIPTAAAGSAIVYRELLDKLIPTTERTSRPIPPRRRTLLSTRNRGQFRLVEAKRPCSVCESIQKLENTYLTDLLDFFDDPKLKPRFANSFGLCLPHLQMAIDQFPNHSNLPRLLEVECKKFAVLKQELIEFHRKRDYRFANEPPGPERNSWRRALELFAGKQGVFPRSEIKA